MITSDKWKFYSEDEFEIEFIDITSDPYSHYISFNKHKRLITAYSYIDYESISLDLTMDDIKFINMVLNKMGWLDETE